MQRKDPQLQKRNRPEEQQPYKIKKRFKQTTLTENYSTTKVVSVKEKVEDKSMFSLNNDVKQKTDLLSSNKLLDDLTKEITRYTIQFIQRAMEKRNTEETPNKPVIAINPSTVKRRVMVFYASQKNKPMDKSYNFSKKEIHQQVNKNFLRLNYMIRNSLVVFYSDFVEELDRILEDTFIHFKLAFPSHYLNSIYGKIIKCVDEYKFLKLNDINLLKIELKEFQIDAAEFPKIPLQTRLFSSIDEYESPLQAKEKLKSPNNHIDELLHSDIKPSCNNGCCCGREEMSIEEYCTMDQLKNTWKTNCEDKFNNIECDANCGCDKTCKNRTLKDYDQSKLLSQVKIQLCWGADLFTRKNICYLMPFNLPFEKQAYYANKVISCLNKSGYEGWNISKCLEYLIRKYEEKINEKEIVINRLKNEENRKTDLSYSPNNYSNDTDFSNSTSPSKVVEELEVDCSESDFRITITVKSKTEIEKANKELLRLKTEKDIYTVLLKNSKITQIRDMVRIHSKGLGVLCNKKEGIKKNDLVVKYIGEVYPVWYWELKQKAIKRFLHQIETGNFEQFKEYKHNYNIDFYNIILEKHDSEPNGKDMVIVDPIIKGNFASRLSHSCNPNCMALPVVSNGKYSIAMFALRDIGYEEELTFDYGSYTENEEEFKTSVCLCGSLYCRGHYLTYTQKHIDFFKNRGKEFLLDNNNFFLKSFSNILKSCISEFDESKEEFLLKFRMGKNTFKDSPCWLKEWSFLTLKDVLEEKKNLYMNLIDKNATRKNFDFEGLSSWQKDIKMNIDSLYTQRLNNIITSIDKARFFISKQNNTDKEKKPFIFLNEKDHFSFIDFIIKEIKKESDFRVYVNNAREKVNNYIIHQIDNNNRETSYIRKIKNLLSEVKTTNLVKSKLILLELSHEIKKQSVLRQRALADLLHFLAFTVVVFTSTRYKTQEIPIEVRECDLTNSKRTFVKNNLPIEKQLENLVKPITTNNM